MTAPAAFNLPDNHRADDKPFITIGEVQIFRLFFSHSNRPYVSYPAGIIVTDAKESVIIPMKDLYHFGKAIVAEYEGQLEKK